ncbi:MAG: DUF2244 domain-containing protein [Gammaproteobacteria bacterium]|jgi:uncharacterized membrane protein|nr:MAG: DUF2244 domain-containing protein [Gammaproteobacteria bacterium]|tara:strand:+ start:206 stop:688 length:483 start_codon:yes stop_codon:yes gene_type:complete
MVKIENNTEENTYRILLRPNQSTDWKTSIIFISIIAITCLAIGIGFAFAGATMILPFAGLEVIFVGVCVYLVMKKTYKQEVITLTQETLKIEKGEGKIDQVWEYFRMWSFVSVERPQHPWYPAHIVVTSKGERVPIGDFLNEDEKEELVSNLERIIQELQ